MTLFEHLDIIDETVNTRREQEYQNGLLLSEEGRGFGAVLGKGFSGMGRLPWQPGSWLAKVGHGDWDQDGHQDFVDFYNGPGAYSWMDYDLPGD